MLTLKRFIVINRVLLWMNWRFIMLMMTRVDGFLGWCKMMITKFLVQFDCWKCIVAERAWLMSLMCWYIQWFWSLFLWSVLFPAYRLCYDVFNDYFIRYWLRRHIMWKLTSKRFRNILINHYWFWCRMFEILIKLRNFSFWWMRFFSN